MPRRECALCKHSLAWLVWRMAGSAATSNLTGIMETAVYNALHCSFFPWFNCKTFLFVQNKLSHKPWSCCKLLTLIPPAQTEILQDTPVQRRAKCVDAEQLCFKYTNGKPCQTSWECEGQNGFLCVSLSFSSLTLLPPPPFLPLSLRSDRPLELPKCHRVCRNKTDLKRYGTVWVCEYEYVPKTGCSFHFSISLLKNNMFLLLLLLVKASKTSPLVNPVDQVTNKSQFQVHFKKRFTT